MTLLQFFLLLLGVSFGSFINVLALRYDPEKPIFSRRILGRSHCSSCGRVIRFFEMVPVLSFLLLRGKCRICKTKLSLQYPIVELSSGLSMMFLLNVVSDAFNFQFLAISGFWVLFLTWALYLLFGLAILTLIFIAAVDARTFIIPDQSNLLIMLIGIATSVCIYFLGSFGPFMGSFVSHYASLFGFHSSVAGNRIFAVFVGILFFGLIVVFTKGRGMGMGDVKLAGALGFLLGWPDLILALALAFITGSIWSILMMVQKEKKFSSKVPFGPFIVTGTLMIVFFGVDIINGYFALFP
ncbi:MAG: hypothetical protein COU07_01610 [Candidatus Harrisonbacteria bacterium CG10_big_fil_rev_8_21_14_0_10_40_38]|uniref:Prepilin peptidase n=1 Tax=Candidatus Harrisonbacteria bacterium CG10_big_fil_rev_8_21_14_0_10_40_38 TaxID=1974583 RepID=A0A2H0UT54_9BACT|nr:MAG: hypothetical protein COU07_01610 [Candidatus Harrisonbacteria bacterium CG10_big_fil_rev_8_21_14_0_10_40_38]